jgi:hypothetical protein
MHDLLVLACANATRVTTYMVARDQQSAIRRSLDAHHEISHHQNVPEAMQKNVKIRSSRIVRTVFE